MQDQGQPNERQLGEMRALLAATRVQLDQAVANAKPFLKKLDETREVFAKNLNLQPLTDEERETCGLALVALNIATAVLRSSSIASDLEALTPGHRGHAPGGERELLTEFAILFHGMSPADRIDVIELARAKRA